MAGAANSPARGAGESLVEFMSRSLEAYGVGSAEREDDGHSHVTQKPLPSPESDFVQFVLNWLNEWDTKELERMHALQVSARLEELRNRARRALKHEASAKTI